MATWRNTCLFFMIRIFVAMTPFSFPLSLSLSLSLFLFFSFSLIYIIMCLSFSPFPLFWSFPFLHLFITQRFMKNFYLFRKKMHNIFCLYFQMSYFCTRFARETKPNDWHCEPDWQYGDFQFFHFGILSRIGRKKKKEKNFRKHLEVMLESSYLCIRFPKRKSFEKSSSLKYW